MFCLRHEWEIEDKTVLPSGVELLKESGITKMRGRTTESLFEKPIVYVLRCAKCRKMKIKRV